MITNEQILKLYLTPQMEQYFQKKLYDQDHKVLRYKIAELLKFLSLCHHCDSDIPISNELDHIWHLWIVQTKQYQELCLKLPSKKFIHHCSNDYPSNDNNVSPEEQSDKTISYLTSYVHNFNYFTEESIEHWPTAKKLYQHFENDIQKLNNYLVSLNKKL